MRAVRFGSIYRALLEPATVSLDLGVAGMVISALEHERTQDLQTR
jgi:hypothetical protein